MAHLEDNDPFSPQNAPKLQLIVQMRIYDVLMALLTNERPDMASKLNELHEAGQIMGALPYIDLTGEEDEDSTPSTN